MGDACTKASGQQVGVHPAPAPVAKPAAAKVAPSSPDPAVPPVTAPAAAVAIVSAYRVEGAGEDGLDGVYRHTSSNDGVPVYVHEKGTYHILRYRFHHTGNAYWFITKWDGKGNTYSNQDVYRTGRTESQVPPTEWLDEDALKSKRPTVWGKKAPTVRPLDTTTAPAAVDDDVEREASYIVTGAGEGHTNGLYLQSGLYDGVPQYMNEHGVTLLRYRFNKSKRAYWFFSERNKDGKASLDRDLYRSGVSEAARPPDDWIPETGAGPKVVGRAPVPTLTLQTLAQDDEDEEDKIDGTAAVDMSYPSYWSNAGLEPGSVFSKNVAPGKATFSAIESLLNQTFTGQRTRDRKHRPMPNSLALRNVLRVENSLTWNRYAAKRAHLRRQACPSLEELYGGAPALTGPGPGSSTGLVAEVNEFYLWHGTKPSSAMNIVSQGFQIDRAGKSHGAMFGPGSYFAEASSKADEYAEDEEDGLYAGLFAMILCRVSCGRFHRVVDKRPDVSGIMDVICNGAGDTVLGDREAAVGTYREFIVFDAAQVYPEYALVYAREYEDADGES